MNNQKRILNMGANAYREGLTQDDNPFTETIDVESYELWRCGWHEEYAWWESQSGIRAKY